jgi:hypothetical protein
MSEKLTCDVPISEVEKEMVMTVRLTGLTSYRARLFVMRCLLFCVAVISPFKVQVEID